MIFLSPFFHDTQTDEQKALWQQILDIVNKTNLIDYTMDIRMRLQLGDKMPDVSARHEQINELSFAFVQINNVISPCYAGTCRSEGKSSGDADTTAKRGGSNHKYHRKIEGQ